jgi:hypothetical protein
MNYLLVIIALGILALLGVGLRLAVDMRAIRSVLCDDDASMVPPVEPSPAVQPAVPFLMSHQQHMPRVGSGRFAVWEWRDGQWRLVSDPRPSGSDPGLPPAYPGAYPGEVVKVWIPKPKS